MLLFRLGLRNLLVQRFKTVIVGSILCLGTGLVIVGTGLLDAIDRGMQRSLVHSVAAHIQLYSASAKDEFQLFGNFDGSMPDSGRIENFARVHRVLSALPNVETVVPMGIDFAVTSTDNFLERKLAELRDAVREGDRQRMQVLKHHVRRIIRVLDKELKNAARLVDVARYKKQQGDHEKVLRKTRSDAFWSGFDDHPLETLEFLENDVGPLALSEELIWVRYLGTDTELFRKTFDRFEIVEGQMIPPGKRGFLFNKRIYEEMLKNKIARRLDRIKERLDDGEKIAECEDCRTWTRLNVNQAASLVFQLDQVAAKEVRRVLQRSLRTKKRDLVALMKRFLRVDDENFRRRRKLFYDKIAPHIVLYTVAIGDEFVLTAFSRGSGYQRRVPVKVYGTFRFRSLDKSPLAGGFNIVDIMSFRDLYGYMTEEKREEQQKIRRSIGVRDIGRADIEQMFGGDKEVVASANKQGKEIRLDKLDLSQGGERFTEEVHQRVYSRDELWNGVVLNAAVMLEDGEQLESSLARIRSTIAREKLGLKAVSWREASGMVGKLIDVIRAVLWGAVCVIFVVALIIINNSLLMATMERTREIGTMRAIGAQRGFVMRMFLFEGVVLAAIFGGIGALLGSGVLLLLKAQGIPAMGDFFYFLFAGPRLHPDLRVEHVLVAYALVMVVSIVATVYPARVATGITPREAMAEE